MTFKKLWSPKVAAAKAEFAELFAAAEVFKRKSLKILNQTIVIEIVREVLDIVRLLLFWDGLHVWEDGHSQTFDNIFRLASMPPWPQWTMMFKQVKCRRNIWKIPRMLLLQRWHWMVQWHESEILLLQAAFNEAFEAAKSGGLAAKQVKPMATWSECTQKHKNICHWKFLQAPAPVHVVADPVAPTYTSLPLRSFI